MLLRNLEEFEIPYTGTILGFSDSLLASRELYPYPETPSHKLSAMLEVNKGWDKYLYTFAFVYISESVQILSPHFSDARY